MRVGGVPYHRGKHPQGPLKPTAVVLHRTYGSWRGDFSVGKNGRDGQGIGFHFLIGKDEGQWAQFYDTSIEAAHAKGANSWSVGVEFEGTNADPLTDWQLRAGLWVLKAVTSAHNIPLSYTDTGDRRRVNGCLPHRLVPGSDHTDFITRADWDKMTKPSLPAELTLQQLLFFAKQTVVGDGRENPQQVVKLLQAGLNNWFSRFAKMTGRPDPEDIPEDGIWGQKTKDCVVLLQTITNKNELGLAGPQTWATLFG